MIKSGLLTLALIFPAVALAQNGSRDPALQAERVSLTDIDLSAATTRSTLQRRIRAAAGNVCDLGGMQSLEDFDTSSTCFARAVAEGETQIDKLIAAKRTSTVNVASVIPITK